MEILVVSGMVAGFIALSEGVKSACRIRLSKNKSNSEKEHV